MSSSKDDAKEAKDDLEDAARANPRTDYEPPEGPGRTNAGDDGDQGD